MTLTRNPHVHTNMSAYQEVHFLCTTGVSRQNLVLSAPMSAAITQLNEAAFGCGKVSLFRGFKPFTYHHQPFPGNAGTN